MNSSPFVVHRALLVLLASCPLWAAACSLGSEVRVRTVAVRELTIDPQAVELEIGGVREISIAGALIALGGATQSLSAEELSDPSLVNGLNEPEIERLRRALAAIVWLSSDLSVASVHSTDAISIAPNTSVVVADAGAAVHSVADASAVGVDASVISADSGVSLGAGTSNTLIARVAGVSEGSVEVTALLPAAVADPAGAGLGIARPDVVATLAVTVRSGAAGSVVASVDNARLPVDATTTISVVAVAPGGEPENVTDVATFEVVQGKDVLELGTGGKVTAKKTGNATVRVTYQEQEDTIEIIVEDVVELVSIDPANDVEVANGSRIAFTASARFRAAGDQDVTEDVIWESTRDTVLSIDALGLAEANSQGTATITATLGEKTAQVEVSVSDAVPQSIEIRPAPVSVAVGQTVRVEANVTDTNGNAADSKVYWSVSDGALASVTRVTDATGVIDLGEVRGVLVGTTQLIAELGDVRSEVVLSVSQPVLDQLHIALAGDTAEVPLGARVQLRATAVHSAAGESMEMTLKPSDVAWRSSDGDTLSVDASGCVEGTKISEGPVTISASYQGLQASAELLVTPAPAAGTEIVPCSTTAGAESADASAP